MISSTPSWRLSYLNWPGEARERRTQSVGECGDLVPSISLNSTFSDKAAYSRPCSLNAKFSEARRPVGVPCTPGRQGREIEGPEPWRGPPGGRWGEGCRAWRGRTGPPGPGRPPPGWPPLGTGGGRPGGAPCTPPSSAWRAAARNRFLRGERCQEPRMGVGGVPDRPVPPCPGGPGGEGASPGGPIGRAQAEGPEWARRPSPWALCAAGAARPWSRGGIY